MLNKKLMFMSMVLLMFGLVTVSFAQMECAGHPSGGADKHNISVPPALANQEKVATVGNIICPVLNEKIDEKIKATYEYKGKVYNFCCATCIEDFKKDPEKYINKVNEELKTLSQDEQTASHH